MKKIITILVTASSLCFSYAQISISGSQSNLGTSNGLVNLLNLAQTIVSRLVPFLVGVAVIAFFWFLITFIWKGQDNPDEQQKSLRGMGMSILALFVMVSIWGIIGFAGSVFGVSQGGSMPAFKLPGEK